MSILLTTEGDGKGQHPLAHRHWWEDLIHEVGCRLSHAVGSAGGTQPTAFAGEGYQLFMGAVSTAEAKKAVR